MPDHPPAPRPPSRSLKAQLQTTLTLTAAAVLLLAGTGSVVYQAVAMHASLRQQIAADAEMIAANVGAALLFDDDHAAAEVLRTASLAPAWQSAMIVSVQGRTVASHYRPPVADTWLEDKLRRLGLALELAIDRPIVHNHKPQGTIHLVWDLHPGYRRLLRQVLADLGILFAALNVATVLGIRLQRRVLWPILHLSSVAEQVALGQDYGRRGIKFADDEVGQLTDRFNQMLARIQERDAHLERLVGERTSELSEANARLAHQAYFDALTGLPNRQLFQDRLEQAIVHAERYREKLAVCFMDLDEFKQINDVFGHETGDQVLRQVAGRLYACLRETDSVARIGGDEFMFLFTGLAQAEDAGWVAEKVLAALHPPLEVLGQTFALRASLGISLYPDDARDPATLRKYADMAMYQAKSHGRDRYNFFTPHMDREMAQRLEIENDLSFALEAGEGQLFAHYQPQFDACARLIGFEALIRWRHPRKGLLSPGLFIPVAEHSGLIARIDTWMLNTVCRQIAEWLNQGWEVPPVSVNLSMKLFRQPDLPEWLTEIVAAHDIDPARIHFEVTESALMENTEQTIAHLQHLRGRGFALSIDDFGTGYSSLNYLKRFPVNTLKIDQGFVRDLAVDRDDANIVRAIITLAHNLGLEVIAEGVETEFQREFLCDHGCDFIQGYLTGRPMAAEACLALLSPARSRRLMGLLAP